MEIPANNYVQQQRQFLYEWLKNEKAYENKRILTINDMDELQYLCVKPDDIIILQAKNGKPMKVIGSKKETNDFQTKQQQCHFHPQHLQTSYDQYPSTSFVNHELLSSTLENDQQSMWPSGDVEWYTHEMKQQRPNFMNTASTKSESNHDQTSKDITQLQTEPIMVRRQVLSDQPQHRVQLENLELKHHLELIQLRLEHLHQPSSSVIQFETTPDPSDRAVAYHTLSLMTKLGTIGKQLIERQHVKTKMQQVLRWILLLLMLIMFGGALISQKKTSTDGNYGSLGLELVLFSTDINLAFEHEDRFIAGLLGDNKIKLLNHWNWLWPYMVP
ncbi:unnamed protein product [Didymodactylos carnosus]|uniref:Uncharacterized protein n=1 Tax=Didymodactylos carnosus TaxID=1234261 RepID=A0A814TA21_9BILA|nr:unnamed protein product [Didymodactylos carnosus]CAF1374327.1 unnamed protein product [Didymodactylos carnosus]CAF3920110.1 unnamed protein product [Didymodactylos carnosus]CAF4183297.1 unnamed protein product [Didymodactylos carnosus]